MHLIIRLHLCQRRGWSPLGGPFSLDYFSILVLQVILTCEFCCVTRGGPKPECLIWEKFVKYCLGPNWPKTIFPVFPTYVQEPQQSHPPILPCLEKCWGLSQSSQDLALQLGIRQLHLRLCRIPASLPWPGEPRRTHSQSSQAAHFSEWLGVQTPGVLPGVPPQPCRPGLDARGPHAGAALTTSTGPDCQEPTADLAGWAGLASRTQTEALVLHTLPRIQAGLCLFSLVKAWMNKRFFKQKHCSSRNKRFFHKVQFCQENPLPCFLWP